MRSRRQADTFHSADRRVSPTPAVSPGARLALPWIFAVLILIVLPAMRATAEGAAAIPAKPAQSLMRSSFPSAQRDSAHGTASGGQNAASVRAQPTEIAIPLNGAWYFYLALLFLCIIVPAYFFRLRMKLMQGRMDIIIEERNRIARECHDTLMAGFAAISWQLEATTELLRGNQLDSKQAAKSCEAARMMVSHCRSEARRIIHGLRGQEEDAGALSCILEHSIAASLEQSSVQTTLQVEGKEVPLTPVFVHHLTCIGQEAVTNAVRHANASHISIRLEYKPGTLRLSVRDDGCGLLNAAATASREGHFGISVMKERAEELGGTFSIQPQAGSGTEVSVEVPSDPSQPSGRQGLDLVHWIGI